MKTETIRRVFFWAAIFNYLIGLGLMFAPGLTLGLIGVTPTIDNPVWVSQFGWLVFMFGVGYHLASHRFERYRPLVELAVIGKLGVGAIALWHVIAGNISWQLLIPAGGDVVWALLFIAALRSPRPAR